MQAARGIARKTQAAGRDWPGMDGIIGFRLRMAQLAVFQDFLDSFAAENAELRPAEFTVLLLLAASPGRKQAEIAETLAIKPANFVALANRLQSRGLIERRKDHADRRAHLLRLSERGLRFIGDMTGIWRKHEQRMIGRLGGQRAADRLVKLLQKLSPPA